PDRPSVIQDGERSIDLSALLVNALRNGADPACPARWPNATQQWAQVIVEMPQVAWALCVLADAAGKHPALDAPWNKLNQADLSRLDAWLATSAAYEHPNNWNLFVAVTQAARERLARQGVAGFHRPPAGVVQDRLRRAQLMHRGGGWYSDADTSGPEAEGTFDDYTPWVILPHQMLWAFLERETPEADTVIPDTGGVGRARLMADTSRYLADQVYWFDANGGHPEYGRSSTYKFARLTAFVLARHLDRTCNTANGWNLGHPILPEQVPPGMLRRLVRLHLNHYFANGSIDWRTGAVLAGQTRESSPEIEEVYITPGSRYWCMYLLGAIWLLPEDDPFWTAPEMPLPSEAGGFSHWMETPGFLTRHQTATAHVELFNTRAFKAQTRDRDRANYANKYSKFVYSSVLGHGTGPRETMDQMLFIGTNALPRATFGDRYLPPTMPANSPGVLRSVHEVPVGAGAARVSTLIFFKDGAHLRLHRITGATGQEIREGGYALGRAADEDGVLVRGGKDWAYSESSRGAAFVASVSGYHDIVEISGTGHHSRDAAWRTLQAVGTCTDQEPTVTALLIQGSVRPFDPAKVRQLLKSVTVRDGYAVVTWSDGETVSAPFPPEP
ncbi:MAG: DUF2264 domain-containing protein, partial [Lacunisphaera sp.]|nr:DUF2264 domain-containing protein [Lacunisphaera sp.]